VKRREFITLLGGAVAGWPLAARAQQPAMPTVGFLRDRTLGTVPQRMAAFRQGLKETGFVEGQNVAIEYRSAEDQTDGLPLLVADLLRRQFPAGTRYQPCHLTEFCRKCSLCFRSTAVS
jgi:putative tryptophan/tyrosine transport system substrate-binding protein